MKNIIKDLIKEYNSITKLNPGKPVPGFGNILSTMVKNDGVFSIYKGVDA